MKHTKVRLNRKISRRRQILGSALFPSPSKIFLIRFTKKRFRARQHDMVIDCAAASLKYRYLFPSARYLGLDLDIDLLAEGLRNYGGDPLTKAEFFDLLSSSYQGERADLVVSTNTLTHFDGQDIATALKSLLTMINEGGELIANLPKSEYEGGDVFLSSQFALLDAFAFQSNLSVRFEIFWSARVGRVVWLLPQLGAWSIAYLLSFLEPRHRYHNQHLLHGQSFSGLTSQHPFSNSS